MSPIHLMAMTAPQILFWHRIAFDWYAERDGAIDTFVAQQKALRGGL